jgi:hypothetical protein
MDYDVYVRCVGLQALTNDESGFSMRIAAGAGENDVRRKGDVTLRLSPHKVECIFIKPHVFTATGDHVGILFGVVFDGPGVLDVTDIGVGLEKPEISILSLGRSACEE